MRKIKKDYPCKDRGSFLSAEQAKQPVCVEGGKDGYLVLNTTRMLHQIKFCPRENRGLGWPCGNLEVGEEAVSRQMQVD